MKNRKTLAIFWLLTLHQVQYNLAHGSDSLRSALEAVTRRQRDLSNPSVMYYLQPEGRYRHAGEEIAVYLPRDVEGDGQPEDIGYGYQKSVAPKTAGIFEPLALPNSELGVHDFADENHPHGNVKGLNQIVLEYLKENHEQPENDDIENFFRDRDADYKRSIFRERGDEHLPDALQHLYLEENENIPTYEKSERQKITPSLFRERFKGKNKNDRLYNAQALVRNFGGLDRDTENQHDPDNDSDDYMTVLNSIWEKYKDSNSDTFDPEDISETDVAELMEYMDTKGEKKRQYGNSYESGYDFFNSPLQWSKRNKQKSEYIYRPDSDGYFHTLNYLSSDSTPDEEPYFDEDGQEITRLLMDSPNTYKTEKNIHRKREWRIGGFDERYPYKNLAKRYSKTKRSPSYYTSPSMLHHKSFSSNISQRKKKDTGDRSSLDETDPKVAKELSNIFSVSNAFNNSQKNKDKIELQSVLNINTNMSVDLKNETQNKLYNKINDKKDVNTDVNNSHKHIKRTGQKEETFTSSLLRPVEVSKKSVNWSDYFGIDRRRKKSKSKDINDEWLLNQYIKAYSLSSNALKDSTDAYNDVYSNIEENNYDMQKKGQDDMDNKLKAMEDLIVDQALKYTGAHEGVTDSKEVQEVKDRVISQLAAAYSLEKMRRALSEFKSSIAAQKASAPETQTTLSPSVSPSKSEKRVAIKKDSAEEEPNEVRLEKKMDHSYKTYDVPSFEQNKATPLPYDKFENCPVLTNIHQRCKALSQKIGDPEGIYLPLCSLHEICYTCGLELAGVTPDQCHDKFVYKAYELCENNYNCASRAQFALTVLQGRETEREMEKEMKSSLCNKNINSCHSKFLSYAINMEPYLYRILNSKYIYG